VVNAEAMKDGRIEIADVHRVFHYVVTVLIRFAISDSRSNPAARHPSSKAAWVVVAAHPFYAVTGADGKYEIKGLPPGDYTIAFVHEKLGEQDQKVTVAAKDSKTLDASFKQ